MRTAWLAVVAGLLFVPSIARTQTAQDKGRTIAIEADRRDSGFGDSTVNLLMVLRGRGGDEARRSGW